MYDALYNKIDGLAYAKAINSVCAEFVDWLGKKYNYTPCFAIVMVGNNTASEIYVRNKIKLAEKIGINVRLIRLDKNISEAEVIDCVQNLNQNKQIHGIIMQLHLPQHIDVNAVLAAISPFKDLDGLTPLNVGLLHASKYVPYTIDESLQMFMYLKNNEQPSKDYNNILYKKIYNLGYNVPFIPCTALGCLYLLQHTLQKQHDDLVGKNVIIFGNSNLVSKPLARLLLQSGATTTTIHSRSQNYQPILSNADIIISATGRRQDVNHIKKNAILIDVGIRKIVEKNIITGDLDFLSLVKTNRITPVPKGVGPMTVSSLMLNAVLATLRVTRGV